jgi:hypothetical protein
VEYSNDAIVTLSLECRITNWNKAAEKVQHYETSQIKKGRYYSKYFSISFPIFDSTGKLVTIWLL